jgi:uncharacterized protein YuzE
VSKYVIDHDPQADSAYIKINGGKVEESLEVNEGLIIDINQKGQLIGVEILNFSNTK